jgi:hypothetical protein
MASTPTDMAAVVRLSETPTVTFSEAMESSTVSALSFTVVQGATNISGAVNLDNLTNTATFTPAAPLANSLVYTARISTAATSSSGFPLAANHTWTFTTTPLELGAAQSYSVLGASVTNTGLTTLGGDLGVSPGTALTGFPPGTASGVTHAGDPQAAQARADVLAAYNLAGARTSTATLSGDLAGRTLTAGVYSSPAALSLSAGLILDGQSNPNAVFIIQVHAAFDTAAASSVTFSNGAKASNVFWQVSGAVTLGASCSFKGTILGATAITVGAGATLEGRALTPAGLVTLSGNSIVMPVP